MRKLLTTLAGAAFAFTICAAPQPVTIAEIMSQNSDLQQDQLSEETYTICTKNTSTGAVLNNKVTVVVAGPDRMFVADNNNTVISVSRPSGLAAFNTVYKTGDQIADFEVRYKANYVTRFTPPKAVPCAIFAGSAYPVADGTRNLNFNGTYGPSSYINIQTMSISAVGRANGYTGYNEQTATWNKTDNTFEYLFSQGTTTYSFKVRAGEMGIDCSAFVDGDYKIFVKGVIMPTNDGADIYPCEVIQYSPVECADIAALKAEALTLPASTNSYRTYILKSKARINAVGARNLFIQDASGAMSIETTNSSIDFTKFNLKAGDMVAGLNMLLWSSSYGGATQWKGVYTETTFPTVDGFETVEFPLYTVAQLKAQQDQLNFRPVKLENVRVKSNNQFEGLNINPTLLMSGFQLDSHKYYTITGILNNLTSIAVISATVTGDVPPVVPVDVANIAEFIEKGANLPNNEKSEQIFRITGKVGVVKYTGTMFIQDATGAIPVQANSTSIISSNPYKIGNVTSGLTLRAQKESNVFKGFFDVDESQWPAAIEDESILPQQVALEDFDTSYEYRWVSLKNVTATSRSAVKMPALHTTSKPDDPASVSVNRNLGSNSISFTKDKQYDMAGVLKVGWNTAATGATSFQFICSSWDESSSSANTDVSDVAALIEATKSLADGEVSEGNYTLGPVYVSLRTADCIFVQTATDGLMIVSSNPDANLYGFDYNYGDVVNGLTGKVKNAAGMRQLLVDPTSYPVSTMNMPMFIQVQTATPAELSTKKYFMLQLETAKLEATRAEGLHLGGLPVVASQVLTPAEDNSPLLAGHIYTLKGVSDGTQFFVYSAEDTNPVGIDAIENAGLQIEAIYTADGVRIAEPVNGVNIIRYSDGSVRKVIIRK